MTISGTTSATGMVGITVNTSGDSNNPSGLRPQFLGYFAAGQIITPEIALEHFHENVYIPGTPFWHKWEEIKKDRQKKAAERYLVLKDVPIVHLPSKRRLSQPKLQFNFETLADIRMRLAGGAIFVGSDLYMVSDVYEVDDDYLLRLRDAKAVEYKCFYKKTPEIDLRSPEPQYFTNVDKPMFLLRPPMKQQRQAICFDNTHCKPVGPAGAKNVQSCDPRALMAGMSREVLIWNAQLYDLLGVRKVFQSVRLSKDVAIYRDDFGLHAEYKGRFLGDVNEDTLTVDDVDAKKPWIRRDTQVVGCKLRVAA